MGVKDGGEGGGYEFIGHKRVICESVPKGGEHEVQRGNILVLEGSITKAVVHTREIVVPRGVGLYS